MGNENCPDFGIDVPNAYENMVQSLFERVPFARFSEFLGVLQMVSVRMALPAIVGEECAKSVFATLGGVDFKIIEGRDGKVVQFLLKLPYNFAVSRAIGDGAISFGASRAVVTLAQGGMGFNNLEFNVSDSVFEQAKKRFMDNAGQEEIDRILNMPKLYMVLGNVIGFDKLNCADITCVTENGVSKVSFAVPVSDVDEVLGILDVAEGVIDSKVISEEGDFDRVQFSMDSFDFEKTSYGEISEENTENNFEWVAEEANMIIRNAAAAEVKRNAVEAFVREVVSLFKKEGASSLDVDLANGIGGIVDYHDGCWGLRFTVKGTDASSRTAAVELLREEGYNVYVTDVDDAESEEVDGEYYFTVKALRLEDGSFVKVVSSDSYVADLTSDLQGKFGDDLEVSLFEENREPASPELCDLRLKIVGANVHEVVDFMLKNGYSAHPSNDDIANTSGVILCITSCARVSEDGRRLVKNL